MYFYWSIWSIFLVMSIVWRENKYNHYYSLLLFFIIILSVISGGRENVGADWGTYRDFYYTGIADDKTSGHTELLFQLLRNISFELGLTYGMFCCIVTMLSLTVLWKSLKILDVRNCFLGFLVYLSLFFCNYQFNIVRHGLLASFIFLAVAYLSKEEKIKAFICVIIGCGFHVMGAIFIPLFFLLNKLLSKKSFIILLVISVFIYMLDLSGRLVASIPFLALINRVESYVDADINEAYRMSFGVVGFIMIAIYSIIFRRNDYENNAAFRITANLLLIGFVTFCTLNAFSTIVQRVGNLLNLGVVFLLPYFWNNLGVRKWKLLARFFIIIYLFLYYPKTWDVPNEMGEYTMLPFRTSVFNLF